MKGRIRFKKKSAGRKTIRSAVYSYTALFEPAVEGGYTVTVPILPGVITEGDTLSEARARVREAVRGYLKVLRKRGSHYFFTHPRDPAIRFSAPHHSGEMKRSPLAKILKRAELTLEEFLRRDP